MTIAIIILQMYIIFLLHKKTQNKNPIPIKKKKPNEPAITVIDPYAEKRALKSLQDIL